MTSRVFFFHAEVCQSGKVVRRVNGTITSDAEDISAPDFVPGLERSLEAHLTAGQRMRFGDMAHITALSLLEVREC